MARTAKSIIISYCKRGISSNQCYEETGLNKTTITSTYSKYWIHLRDNPVSIEVKRGKQIMTIQSKINFEKLIK